MAKIFDNILLRGVRSGQIPARTEDARKWFRDIARNTGSNERKPERILESSKNKTSRVLPGRMYHFFYDPKTKEKLPYYDVFPLIFMVGKAEDGFYGINLHYLPPQLRAKLMDALYEVVSDKRYDENTKLRISYNILQGAAKYRYFKPCFKHYLTKHVRSRFVEVLSTEWDIALFLPTERFLGANKQKIWSDSRKQIT
jgi:hypothetical protein